MARTSISDQPPVYTVALPTPNRQEAPPQPSAAPEAAPRDTWTAPRQHAALPGLAPASALHAPVTRALARRLAREAAQSLKAKQVEPRAHEREIGRLAPQNPRARAAARALLEHAVSFLQEDCGMAPQEVLAAFTGKHAPHRTGAVLPEDVPAAMNEGNLREQLALVDVAARTLSKALLALGERAASDPAFKAALQANAAQRAQHGLRALRVDTIVDKFQLAQRLGGGCPYDSLVLRPDSPLQTLPDMRRERSFTVVDRSTHSARSHLVHHVRTRHETGRKAIDFDEHSALPLSEREQRSLLVGYRERSPESESSDDLEFLDVAHERMPLTEGTHGKAPNLEHPWMAAAAEQGHPLTAGISGHTYKFLSLFHDLGGAPEQMQDLRLACLAFLVPAHHAYHEVMASAAEYPHCPYDPQVDTAERLVQQLRAEFRPPVTRSSTRVAILAAASRSEES